MDARMVDEKVDLRVDLKVASTAGSLVVDSADCLAEKKVGKRVAM